MKCCAAAFISFWVLVSSGYSQDTVQVKAGWNIIGSVKAGAVPDVLSTFPDSLITTSFFGYAPGVGYQSTDTLGKGIGYWVKVKADGDIIFNTPPPPSPDTCKSKAFIYEGKLYHTVLIGDQCWMAENLDVGTMVTGVTNQTDNDTTEKYCKYNQPINCALYGGLYRWNEAMQYSTTPGTRGICPAGWHIPTLEEFQTLSATVGGDGNALKAVGQLNPPDGEGTNTSGFSALLWGAAEFWGSTEDGATNASYLGLASYGGDIFLFNVSKNLSLSVRCLED